MLYITSRLLRRSGEIYSVARSGNLSRGKGRVHVHGGGVIRNTEKRGSGPKLKRASILSSFIKTIFAPFSLPLPSPPPMINGRKKRPIPQHRHKKCRRPLPLFVSNRLFDLVTTNISCRQMGRFVMSQIWDTFSYCIVFVVSEYNRYLHV